MTQTPPLDGYVVVDLSCGIAGAYCTKLLADGGADVVIVEGPEGHPLRRWSASGARIEPGEDGALFSFLSCSKESAVADPSGESGLRAVADLLAAADAVVWSAGSRLADHPSLSPQALRRSHPHLAITAISPFGLEGPWRDRPATDFTLQAWSGGIIGLGRGAPDTPPISVGGRVVEWLGGVHAAIGALAARLRGPSGGAGELVDVSLLEVASLCLTYYPVTFHDIAGRPYRSVRSIPTPGVEVASDGYVGLGTGTGQQWLDFCAMVGHPEWAEDESLRYDRKPIAAAIHEWMASHTSREILELASAFRIPSAPIGNGESLPKEEHFRERDFFATNPRDGFVQPGRPYRFNPPIQPPPAAPPRLGEHTGKQRMARERRPASGAAAQGSLPLAGLRVLDMTAFWAGPLCGHVLALLGAEVIHLESPERPDGTRLLGGLAFTDDRWWERSGIFSGINTNKKSVTLDLNDERGKQTFRALLATCDVMVENYTPRVLEQLGLGADEIRAIRPGLVMVRMPGFGLTGLWRDNPAFAFVIEDASGLSWLTGYPDATPLSPYCLGDPVAGLHAVIAILIALEHRRRSGEGVHVEAAMVEAAINVAAEQIVEFSAYGALLERDGNHGPAADPQDVYRTGDEGGDSWVAVSVATPEQREALRELLGLAGGASNRLIDERLVAWCRELTSEQIVDRLWAAGIPVGKVVQPHQQVELPQLSSRHFFETVEHPVTGAARHSTLPIRWSAGPERFHVRHAPLFGEHTAGVLSSIGMSETEIAALQQAQVTATAPTTGSRAAR
jgi:crotonobetainyl-CoA:carnitine CoA-transferase CaiB-like acyl-CoA transferase